MDAIKRNAKVIGGLLLVCAVVGLYVRGCNIRKNQTQQVQELHTQNQQLRHERDSLRLVAETAERKVFAKADSATETTEDLAGSAWEKASPAMRDVLASRGDEEEVEEYSEVEYDPDPETVEGRAEPAQGSRVQVDDYGDRYHIYGWFDTASLDYSLSANLRPQRLEIARINRASGSGSWRETVASAPYGRITRLSSAFAVETRADLRPQTLPPRWRFFGGVQARPWDASYLVSGTRLLHLFRLGHASVDLGVTGQVVRPLLEPTIEPRAQVGLEITL